MIKPLLWSYKVQPLTYSSSKVGRIEIQEQQTDRSYQVLSQVCVQDASNSKKKKKKKKTTISKNNQLKDNVRKIYNATLPLRTQYVGTFQQTIHDKATIDVRSNGLHSDELSFGLKKLLPSGTFQVSTVDRHMSIQITILSMCFGNLDSALKKQTCFMIYGPALFALF
uniref:Uncharacterized protein n=1 Tax=Physcomitrium patens TaxID=3218 RepID=A0A2K1JIT7_PHYPA|nr:hypothetical protein PHYPA_018864 [Physcomitrium patens]